jgi:alkyldihydroxyacetonephosphate synthase
LVLTHLSHVYRDGASIYVTYIFRRAADPEGTFSRWQELKTAASEAIVTMGGTISHQHGVGRDHAPYLVAEKGQLGLKVLTSISNVFDPDGLLNPGKLILNAAPNEKRTSASTDIL